MTRSGLHRTLIIARLPGAEDSAVATIFADSDRTELPGLVGVQHRSLWRLGEVYVHLVEADRPVDGAVRDVRQHPLFVDINRKLQPYVAPYDPATWKSPSDAMANCFYQWDAG
jgi:cyclase